VSKKSYEIGSGNVFKDLGIPNAEEHLVKAQLVFKIDTIMKDRGLKQAEAADLLGVKQPDVSKMLRGDFKQFSVERLLRFLVALDQDVEIVVRPHRGRNDARKTDFTRAVCLKWQGGETSSQTPSRSKATGLAARAVLPLVRACRRPLAPWCLLSVYKFSRSSCTSEFFLPRAEFVIQKRLVISRASHYSFLFI
jgi:predicted XRE-type DNA-binding protein